MPKLTFRTQFDERVPVVTLCPEPSLAQQSFKDEVDINFLLEKFKVTGSMPTGVRLPSYGDFTGVSDYQTAMNAINVARDEFMRLPAEVRSTFSNDPQRFLEFCSDPKNSDKLVEMGLATKPAETTVQAIQSLAKQMAADKAAGPDQGPTAAGPSTASKP